MFHLKSKFNRMMNLSIFLSVWFVAIGFPGSIVALAAGPAPVDLLSAGNFVILAETGITNTGSHTSDITGNIGNSPGTSAQMDGVWCSEISGTIYGVDVAYTGNGTTTCFAGNPPLANKTFVDNAVNDMLTAYNNAAGVVTPAPVVELGAGDISGLTIAPGLYKWSTNVVINTNVTLSGGANDVWIFQIAGDLNIAAGASVATGTKVILSGGARASNIFWQVGGVTGATLGTYSTFNGIILSAKQIILKTGAVLNGKALAQTQVTLESNPVTEPCPPITLSPTILPAGTVNSPYSRTITAGGGTGPYTFATTSGTLPAGLAPITNAGTIAGRPTEEGTFTFTITATDDNGCAGLREYTLVVNPEPCPPVALSPTVLPAGTVNSPYSRTITASGGLAPYAFATTSGTLPAGLAPITNAGTIAGTPTEEGTFTFTITAEDANGCAGLREYTLVVNSEPCPPVALSPTVLPAGTLNSPYSRTITAGGGSAPYAFATTSGTLPAGLAPITNAGLVAGTPTEEGTFAFTITATDQNGCAGLREYTLVVNPEPCPPVALSPTVLPAGTLNSPYSQTITAGGGSAPYAFATTSGTLPAGLAPITNAGLVAGTPTEEGTFAFTITAEDANGCAGLREYTLVVNPEPCPPVTLSPTVLPAGTVNSPYSRTITAGGGTGPYTFATTSGTLPAGLAPITNTGLIAGTPTEEGTFTFTITAEDANGCTGLREYTLVINPAACPLITFFPTVLPAGTVNIPYNQTIAAYGGLAPYVFATTSGTLPAGLAPITNTGLIAGTPTEEGTFTFTITAEDANGCTGLREYTLVINPAACPLITFFPTVLPAGTVNIPYSQTIAADGGLAPYEFAVTSGTLPAGLAPITNAGLIAGTPTEEGTFTFTITATDANGCAGLREYTIVVPAIWARLELLKTVSGGSASATDFILTATGDATTGLTVVTGTTPVGPVNVPVGIYTLTETGPNGYASSGFTATGGGTLVGNLLTIDAEDAGKTITITIANTFTAIPTLSEWGLIICMILLGLASMHYMKRRKFKI